MKPIRVKPKPSKTSLLDKTQRKPNRWLLNAFIYLLIFLNAMIILLSFLAIAYIGQEKVPNPTLYTPTIYGIVLFLALLNIFCLTNILKLQRWAFWGYCLVALATLILQLSLNLFSSKALLNAVLTLANPLILFAILNVGGLRSAWYEMSKKQIS